MLLLALGALGGCAPAGGGTWLDRREADGACFDVDLADGLDTESTGELRDLYACLNQGGNLDALGGLVAAMEQPTRAGLPAGVELAGLVNTLLDFGVDLLGLAGELALALSGGDEGLHEALALSLELIYGRPWPELRDGAVQLNTDAALEAGLVVPALGGLRAAAGSLLDSELAPLSVISEAADSELGVRALHTSVAVLDAPELADTVERLPENIGEAVLATRSPEDDLWTGASGDSLRDLLVPLLGGPDGGGTLSLLTEPLLPILADDLARSKLRGALEDLRDGDNLEALPPQLLRLVSEDAEGAPLEPGSSTPESALYALLRLLSDADGPMTCRVELDLLPGSWDDLELLELSVDNLAETLLSTIARWEPDQVVGGVDALGRILGLSITDDVLYAIADQGTCDRIDRQLVADLHALDRFNDADTPDLLPLLLEVLGALYDPDGSDDHIPELVDLAGGLYREGAAHPTEELLRDLAGEALIWDLFALLPVLLEPEELLDTSGFPEGVRPLDFEAAWELVDAALRPDEAGASPIDQLAPALSAALNPEGSWRAIGALAELLAAPEARVAELSPWLRALADADPLLEGTREAVHAALDPSYLGPALRIAELPEITEALAYTELSSEGPLPWYARLVTDGTLEDLLRVLDGLLRSSAARGAAPDAAGTYEDGA